MKWSKTFVNIAAVVILTANCFLINGCGTAESVCPQADIDAQSAISEEGYEIIILDESLAVQTVGDVTQEQGAETDGIDFYADRKTQEEYDAEDLAKRAMLEEKIQAAGGISEEEAIEIAEEAMETDIGVRSESMQLHIESTHGWSSFLWDITGSNWKEYQDRGEIAYFIQFDDIEDVWYSYHCVVNALDGSILDAYGLTLAETYEDCDAVYYQH